MHNGPRDGVWSSPFNPATDASSSRRRVMVADCTLRDGEQQAGIAFDGDSRVRIAAALEELGVHDIEVGMPASSEQDQRAIKQICDAGYRAKISVFCRALTQDVDLALSLGATGVRISFPISHIERQHKLKGISDEAYLERALEITTYARDAGAEVIFSPYDTTRADAPFLRTLVAALDAAASVDQLRVVDTTGCALPEGIAAVVGEIRAAAPRLPLEIHCHNDFGLACANTLAGVLAGADFVSTTVNGLGERSGNTATEEVAMALEGLYGIDTGLDLAKLTSTSRLVAELSGVAPPPNKAVVGENAFRHEAGMVVAGVLQDPYTAEPYAPEIVGQRRRIVLGKMSGIASVAHKVSELSLPVAEDRFDALLQSVKAEATQRRRSLTDEEFAELATAHAG